MTDRPHLIAVDARPLAFPATGNATYLHRMLLHLMPLRPETDWLLLSHRGLHPTFADVVNRPRVELNVDQSMFARLGPLWMHLRLPGILKAARPDLFWGTLAMLPLNYRRRCPYLPAIVNFHDLNSVRAPETMPLWKRLQHQFLDQRTLRAADRILCLSKTTQSDIQTAFPDLPAKNLAVVYPGAELPAGDTAAPRGPVGTLTDFFLCVGTLEPRKNQATLLEAYLAAGEKQSGKGGGSMLPPLVFVGRRGWDEELYRRLSSGDLESRNIYFVENASNAELQWCYRRAACVCLPSLHEGFGLPVIEAFQLGKPAILSDIPIFREVGADSRFVRTTDVADWRDALLETGNRLRQTTGSESEPAGLRPPEFDAKYWSHTERARVLSEIMDQALAGR
ncbi:MAG: glycosyltransferase family 4 protein [bacterium]|nr:glycosyltransferase family 4 protein [bacterium]